MKPPDADMDSLREINFNCNNGQQLKHVDSTTDLNEIEHIVSLVEMTKRGIRNQETPHSYEAGIDPDRLLAMRTRCQR